MDKSRIEDLFERMARHDGINDYVMGALLEAMVGRSMQVCIPLMERAYAVVADAGALVLEDGMRVTTAPCPQGPHGGVWRQALVMTPPAHKRQPTLVLCLELEGEPDPGADQLMESFYKAMGRDMPASPEPVQGPARAIQVYAVEEQTAIEEVLDCNARGQFRLDGVIKSGLASPPWREDAVWGQPMVNVVGNGPTVWQDLFAAMSGLVSSAGLDADHKQIAAHVSARRWNDPNTGSTRNYGAAGEMAAELAIEDSYMPGRASARALADLYALSMQRCMEEIGSACMHMASMTGAHPGVVDEDGLFWCNDMRNSARVVQSLGGITQFKYTTGNHDFLLTTNQGDAWRVQARNTDEPHAICLELDFRQGVGGYRLEMPLEYDVAMIRAWNDLSSVVPSVDCCMEEAIGRQASRGPSRRGL